MTPLVFRLQESLVVKAARLNASRYTWRFFAFAAVVGILVPLSFLYQAGQLGQGRALLQISLTLAGALAIAAVIMAVLRLVVFPLQARRNFRQQKALSEEMQLSWHDSEFRYTTGKSQTVMPFTDLFGYRTSEHVILLYLTDVLYLLVPVATFESEQQKTIFVQKLHDASVRRL